MLEHSFGCVLYFYFLRSQYFHTPSIISRVSALDDVVKLRLTAEKKAS